MKLFSFLWLSFQTTNVSLCLPLLSLGCISHQLFQKPKVFLICGFLKHRNHLYNDLGLANLAISTVAIHNWNAWMKTQKVYEGYLTKVYESFFLDQSFLTLTPLHQVIRFFGLQQITFVIRTAQSLIWTKNFLC